MRTALALVLLFSAVSGFAADSVYRWVDKDGVIHYGGQPPSKDAKPAALPEIQTYSNRTGNKAAKNARPIAATSMTFNGIERGEHNVTAAVLDATGKELMRAPAVTFHSKPPTAR